jgi:hypothetical protein
MYGIPSPLILYTDLVHFECVLCIRQEKVITLTQSDIIEESRLFINLDTFEAISIYSSTVNVSIVARKSALLNFHLRLTREIYSATIACKTVEEGRIRHYEFHIKNQKDEGAHCFISLNQLCRVRGKLTSECTVRYIYFSKP